MKYFLIVAFLSLFISCNSQDKRPLICETEYQHALGKLCILHLPPSTLSL